MEHKEFAKYHTWCEEKGIRVYPIPAGANGQFNLAVERNGMASVGQQVFYDKPATSQQISVWEQIGTLLKAIVYKDLGLMELKSTFDQLEGICTAAMKKDKKKVLLFLTAGVPFREAILYMEAFYPEQRLDGKLIYKLAHCKCGNPIVFKDGKTPKECSSCVFSKGMKKIEFINQ